MIPGWGRPPGGGLAAPSRLLAWRIAPTEEPGGLQSRGHKELDTTEQLTISLSANTSVHKDWVLDSTLPRRSQSRYSPDRQDP